MISISFEKVTLSNGLDVIFHQDRTLPVVAVNVWYHVGSKDEAPGRTGFAHLFEHVMFEGSKHHNRSHFEPLQKAGATLNGSTTADRTNYWEDVPANYLELALWLEADRMGFLLDALDQQRFDIQRDVVKNERRQSYENRPYGMARLYLEEALFPLPHPYHWSTIGSPQDLDAASLEDAKSFFRRFYAPSNSSLAIAGDFDRDEALALVNRCFGDLLPGLTLRRLGRQDSALAGRVELEMRDRVLLPRLYIAWPTPPALDPDDPSLALLGSVLGDGLTSRLHRSLVYEQQIAQSVNVHHYPAEIAGQFIVDVTAAADHDLKEVEAATDAELERIRREPPTQEEIARAKNRLEAHHYRQLARLGGFGGRADQLNYFNVFASDPELINSSIHRYLAVSGDDILRVGASTLDHRQVRLRVLPEPPLRPATVALDRSVMPGPAREPAFVAPTPQRRVLGNGLGVAVVEKRGMPIVAFGLLLRGGAAADPRKLPGLASFTARMLSEGTETRSSQEIAAAFEFIGARLSTDTRREYTLLSSETLAKHWPVALEVVADLVQHPSFPEHELERVRRQHLTDLRRAKDDANAVAQQIAPGLVFGRESSYGHPIQGTEIAMEALKREDTRGHFQHHYSPRAATLIVAGDVGLDEVMERAERVFGSWDGASPPDSISIGDGEGTEGEAGPTTIFLVDKPGAAQSVIGVGQSMVPRQHGDYWGLTLLNHAFGGQFSARLNQNLRQDKGYSYGFHSSIQWHRGPSLLLAGGSVQTAATKEAVWETLREFRHIHRSRPLSPEELEAAKAGLLRGYPATFERPGQVLSHLVQWVVYDLPEDYFQTVSAKVAAVTLAEAHRIGAERVRPDGLKVLVVGDRQAVEPGLRELALPLVVLDRDGAQIA